MIFAIDPDARAVDAIARNGPMVHESEPSAKVTP
jgi:hypothetical protein